MEGRERRLARAIRAERDAWDWILIDCPPSLGLLTVNALTAADAVLIPIQCEYYALEGLSQLLATVNLVRDHLHPELEIAGVLLTMFDARTNLSTEVAAEVEASPPRRGVRGDRPAQRPPVGGTEPRPADRPLPAGFEGRRGLQAARRRVPRAPRRPARDVAAARDRTREPRHDVKADRSGSALGSRARVAHPAAAIRTRPRSSRSPLARIAPNPYQPRRRMDDAVLEELAASIREHGVLQPVLVTETLDGYQLVAGERRVRAARIAGLERIPALVRQLADRDQLEVALVENVQRADLDPIDEATAYRQLLDEFGLTQERVAERVGKSRASGREHPAAARPPPGRPGRDRRRAAQRGPRPRARRPCRSTARPTCWARSSTRGSPCARPRSSCAACASREPPKESTPAAPRLDPDLERVEEDLRQRLGTKVSLSRSRKGGRIVIEYYSDEELGRLYERLIGGTA